MLLLHELAQDAVIAAVAEGILVGSALAAEDFAPDVNERLDVGMELTAVLRLDVEDAVPVFYIGVVARDHREIVALSCQPSAFSHQGPRRVPFRLMADR
jgi:hypothetical protein